MSIPVKRLDPDAFIPTKTHSSDAGYDLYFRDRRPLTLRRGQMVKLALGVAFGIPDGSVGLLRERSSLAAEGLHVLGGVIDSGYRGEVSVVLKNLGSADLTFHRGDRIAQMVVLKLDPGEMQEVIDLPASSRNTGGFGSSGR